MMDQTAKPQGESKISELVKCLSALKHLPGSGSICALYKTYTKKGNQTDSPKGGFKSILEIDTGPIILSKIFGVTGKEDSK